MRTIDADALKELFSEVIGHIAKKPEMNGNLEHMIRASAMVIQMIDDAPTVQPDTTTHDSNVVKKGGNDDDRTSGDCISRQQAIEAIHEDADWLAAQGSDWQVERMERDKSILKSLPSVQPETNCSEIPNNSDAISRQAAIDALRKMQTYKLFAGDDMLLIDQAEAQTELMMLPPVQPVQRWIPVTERLPEDEYVLISKKPSKISGDKWCVAIAIRTADPRSRKIQWRDSGFGVIQDDKVLAWLPLPKPYQEGGEKE